MPTIKITEINDEKILFSDGTCITYEYNYADFNQLDDLARNYKFQKPLDFELVNGYGFLFGDSRRMFFVPCYSIQNDYYTDQIDIYYTDYENGNKPILSFYAKFVVG